MKESLNDKPSLRAEGLFYFLKIISSLARGPRYPPTSNRWGLDRWVWIGRLARHCALSFGGGEPPYVLFIVDRRIKSTLLDTV